MKLIKIQSRNGVVRRFQMKEINPGHRRSTDVGGTFYNAEVYIDFEAVHYLANRAALNKSGKCKSGPVLIKCIAREEVP